MPKFLELAGETYGRLKVISRHQCEGKPRWLCLCSCGNEKVVAQSELRTGDAKSCGCLKSEQIAARNHKHGLTDTYTYNKWKGMHRRVATSHLLKNRCYAGVVIDPAWGDYATFLADMGECAPGMSLDRIDNTLGYTKSNCRWVPLSQQATNTRRLVYVEYNGRSMHISEAARQAGLPTSVVFDRLNKLCWSLETALNTPMKVNKNERKQG